MAQKYKTILTRTGKEKMASLVAGEKLEFTHLAVGDGELEPNEEQTSLQNEKYRGDVQKVEISSTKGNRVNILGIIPKNVGGFWIREVGVFDADGDLIAVGNVGETYKSLASDGSDKELGYNVIIEVDNIDNIELEIDESILYVTKNEYLEDYTPDLIKYIGDGEDSRAIPLPDNYRFLLLSNNLTAATRQSTVLLVNPQVTSSVGFGGGFDIEDNFIHSIGGVSISRFNNTLNLRQQNMGVKGIMQFNKKDESYKIVLVK